MKHPVTQLPLDSRYELGLSLAIDSLATLLARFLPRWSLGRMLDRARCLRFDTRLPPAGSISSIRSSVL